MTTCLGNCCSPGCRLWCLWWCLFVLSFFPRGVLDEILNLIESVSEDFTSYSYKCFIYPSSVLIWHHVVSYLFLLTIQSSPPVRLSTCVIEWIINWIDGKRNVSVFYSQLLISQSRSSSQTTYISKYLFCFQIIYFGIPAVWDTKSRNKDRKCA